MHRRNFVRHLLTGAGALGLSSQGGCIYRPGAPAKLPALQPYDVPPVLAPIRAHTDRIFRITVCLRPFRAEGPRLEVERVGDKLVVHNYGHGGSGWSLSWGSSALAVRQALAGSQAEREIAVLGCGALGLTSALLLQRAGAKVTIYAKDQAPDTRSSRATGSWTPDSRVALAQVVPAAFAARWEEMARFSFAMYQSYLGMAGNPIEWTDRYSLSNGPPIERGSVKEAVTAPEFARFQDRIRDLTPRSIELPPGTHPFPVKRARFNSSLTFNVAAYSRQLTTDFLLAGGKLEPREFHSPAELSGLPQKVFINATGYGARALWQDNSITPVRGQIAWLIPQSEVHYGLNFEALNVVARRDGIVVQASEQGEATGWQDSNESPDRAEADRAVEALASLCRGMKPVTGRKAKVAS